MKREARVCYLLLLKKKAFLPHPGTKSNATLKRAPGLVNGHRPVPDVGRNSTSRLGSGRITCSADGAGTLGMPGWPNLIEACPESAISGKTI